MERVWIPESRAEKNVACLSADALGSISIVPIKQRADMENVCVKTLSKRNDPKLSWMVSQKH